MNGTISLKIPKWLTYLLGLGAVNYLMDTSPNAYFSFDVGDEEILSEADIIKHLSLININCNFSIQKSPMASLTLTRHDLHQMMSDKLVTINLLTDHLQDLRISSLGIYVKQKY